MAELKSAKRAGCPAFRSTRVDLGEFLRWRFSSAGEGNKDAPLDLYVERAKREQAERKLAEFELEERVGNLVEKETVKTVITNALLPVRQRLQALPTEAAHRCNPSDPALAQEALKQWVLDALPLIRRNIQKA